MLISTTSYNLFSSQGGDTHPFELPHNWRWIRIGSLLREPLSNGRSVPTQEGGFPVLRLPALRGQRVDITDFKEGAWTFEEAKPWLVEQGDYLIARGNGSINLVGRGALVIEAIQKPVAFPDTMIRMRVFPTIPFIRFSCLRMEQQIYENPS